MKTWLLPMTSAACALLWCAAPPATADAYVDRNLMNHLGSIGVPSSLVPAKTAALPANTVTATSAPASASDANTDPSGAYTVSVVSSTMYSKNVVYITPLPAPHLVGARMIINSVAWQYGTKTPSGFQASLCWKNNKTCFNVSRSGSGQTGNFNGKDASQSFFLQYEVTGTGPLVPPVSGDTAQIIVSYRVGP
jgi:hypothetical protein